MSGLRVVPLLAFGGGFGLSGGIRSHSGRFNITRTWELAMPVIFEGGMGKAKARYEQLSSPAVPSQVDGNQPCLQS